MERGDVSSANESGAQSSKEKALTGIPSVIVGLLRQLDSIGVKYAIGGSFASSAWGKPRQTHDLDIVVLIDLEKANKLMSELDEAFLVDRSDVEAAISSSAEFRSFQILHMEEVFKVDVFLPDNPLYGEEMMSRRRPYRLSPNYEGMFCSAEDIVISKLRWFVLGDRVSDRQWNDIVQVLESRGAEFEYGYALRWATHFGVVAELEEARSQVLS